MTSIASHVPEHRPYERAEYHRGGDQFLLDQPLADRVGDGVEAGEGDGEKIGREVEYGGKGHCMHRRKQARRHHRGD